MMRKFTHYFLVCTIWCSVVSCDSDEEVSAPPKPSLSVDKTAGLVGDTEFAFTVQQVAAETITLFPYGTNDPGIVVSSFEGGSAVINFTYDRPGVFEVVVRSNNHSTNGESVKNALSDPITITITSDDGVMTAFSFASSTETDIDEGNDAITVTVPYGTDVTALKAVFSASAFSTVTVGGVEQESGKTVNNFTNPVVYVVTSENGAVVNSYTVTVEVTDPETSTDLKTITAKAVSKDSDDKELGVYVDNMNYRIVVYDTINTASTQFDSVRIGYETMSSFAIVKYAGDTLDQDSLLNLTSLKQIEVVPQNTAEGGTPVTYDIHYADAPKIDVAFNTLNPVVSGESTNFAIDLKVLNGTNVASIPTSVDVELPAGVTIAGYSIDGAPFVPGTPVDFTEPVSLELSVVDTGLGFTYTVTYTISVTVLK